MGRHQVWKFDSKMRICRGEGAREVISRERESDRGSDLLRFYLAEFCQQAEESSSCNVEKGKQKRNQVTKTKSKKKKLHSKSFPKSAYLNRY